MEEEEFHMDINGPYKVCLYTFWRFLLHTVSEKHSEQIYKGVQVINDIFFHL